MGTYSRNQLTPLWRKVCKIGFLKSVDAVHVLCMDTEIQGKMHFLC